MKGLHSDCCGVCKKIQRLPLDPESAKHYDVLKSHLVCLKNESDRKVCARKDEIRSAALWILEILAND